MKPAITTITLLVANFLVLGYILLIDGNKRSTPEAEREGDWLMNFEPEDVTRVLLRTSAGEAEVVKLSDGSWRFTAPFEDRFDPRLMKDLLEDAGKMKINDTISSKEIKKEGWDDKYFGFDERAVEVEFFNAEGDQLAGVELGGATPFERTIYARRPGASSDEGVHYVWGDLYETVSMPFDDLRDIRLIYTKVDDVFRVKFRPPPAAGGLEVSCQKDREGRWRMKMPLQTRCDQELVKDLVATLAKLEVAEFVDQPDADVEAAFDDKRYTIVLRQRTPATENQKLTIEFGKLPADENDPYVLARVTDRKGVVFRVDKRVYYDFGMDANSLRDRTLGDFDYNALAGVKIKRDGDEEEIVLQRFGSVWALQRDPTNPKNIESANGRMVKDLIDDINSEEIVEFASDAPADLDDYGLKDPAMEITIKRWYYDLEAPVEEGKEPQLLEAEDTLMLGIGFINQPAGQAFAKFKSENYVYRISNILPPKIARAKAIDYKTLQLWPQFYPTDLRRVTIADKRTPKPLVLDYNPDRNAWTVTQGGVDVTGDLERVVLDGYLQYIGRPPRGEDWTPKTDFAAQLLEDPDLMITIDLVDPENPKVPRRIVFRAVATNKAQKFFYGQVNDGKDVVFLSGETIRYLSSPLRRLNR